MSESLQQENFEWILQDGSRVSEQDLVDEIALVPRTRFWRLSHVALLWPKGTNPDSASDVHGFADGFALELVPIDQGIEWVLQPAAGDERTRISGRACDGRTAIKAAFQEINAIHATRMKERLEAPTQSPAKGSA